MLFGPRKLFHSKLKSLGNRIGYASINERKYEINYVCVVYDVMFESLLL